VPGEKQLEEMEKRARKQIVEEGVLDGDGRASRDGVDKFIAAEVADAIERDMRRDAVTLQGEDGTRKAPVVWADLPKNQAQAERDLAHVAPLIAPLRRKLAFRTTTAERVVGAQLRGRLDGRRLAEVPVAIARGRQPRAFARPEKIAAPKIGVKLLIDCSGSMGVERSSLARQAAILFREALEGLRRETRGDVDYTIHGHSTRPNAMRGEECAIYRIADKTHSDLASLGGIRAMQNNHDGPALAAIADQAQREWPDRQRVIIYVNDGQPAGAGYGGRPAMLEIAAHRKWLAARGTTILTLFLGNGGKPYHLRLMYGEEGVGFIMVREISQLPAAVGKALTKLLKWHA
jgi:nitric oxide reductase activation protein